MIRAVRQAVAAAMVASAALAVGAPNAAGAQLPTPAVIALDPACGPAALPVAASTYTITVLGDNFNPFTAVLVTFDAAAGGRPESTRAETDGFGHFQATIKPQQRPAGSYLVRADDFKQREAVTSFTVPCQGTPSPTPSPGAPSTFTPTLRFDPAIGPPGFVTTAIGSGFPTNQPVSLTWDAIPAFPITSPVIADGNGNFTIQGFLIFHHTPVGPYTLTARPGGTIGFPDTTTQFLVVPGTAEPPDFKVRK